VSDTGQHQPRFRSDQARIRDVAEIVRLVTLYVAHARLSLPAAQRRYDPQSCGSPLPLPAPCRLVQVLRPVVEPFALPMFDAGHDLPFRSTETCQTVRDHGTGWAALLLEQLAQEAEGGVLVTPALDEDVEHQAVLVHSAPEPVLLARDRQHDFINTISSCSGPLSQGGQSSFCRLSFVASLSQKDG